MRSNLISSPSWAAWAILVFLVVLPTGAWGQEPVPAQRLDDATIEAAVKAGLSGKFEPMIHRCTARAGFWRSYAGNLINQPEIEYSVVVSTNIGMVALLADQAKRHYKTFAVADVPDSLRVLPRRLFVTADPPQPIEHVLLKSKSVPTAVAQPSEAVEGLPPAFATFALEVFTNLPPGDVDVVLITGSGERRCKIGKDDRARLLRQ